LASFFSANRFPLKMFIKKIACGTRTSVNLTVLECKNFSSKPHVLKKGSAEASVLQDLTSLGENASYSSKSNPMEKKSFVSNNLKENINFQIFQSIISQDKAFCGNINKSLCSPVASSSSSNASYPEGLSSSEFAQFQYFSRYIKQLLVSSGSLKGSSPTSSSSKSASPASSVSTPSSNYSLEKWEQFIAHLLSTNETCTPIITEQLIEEICKDMNSYLKKNPLKILEIERKSSYIPLSSNSTPQMKPLIVVGDLYNHFPNLMHIFNDRLGGFPSSSSSFLFLGNIIEKVENILSFSIEPKSGGQKRNRFKVSFKPKAFECLMVLLSLKLALPNNIHLLKGSNEQLLQLTLENLLKRSSLLDLNIENRPLAQQLLTLLKGLPLAAVVEESTLCVNSGIHQKLASLSLDDLKRVFNNPQLSSDDEGITLQEAAEEFTFTVTG
jgi:hypothetical protein